MLVKVNDKGKLTNIAFSILIAVTYWLMYFGYSEGNIICQWLAVLMLLVILGLYLKIKVDQMTLDLRPMNVVLIISVLLTMLVKFLNSNLIDEELICYGVIFIGLVLHFIMLATSSKHQIENSSVFTFSLDVFNFSLEKWLSLLLGVLLVSSLFFSLGLLILFLGRARSDLVAQYFNFLPVYLFVAVASYLLLRWRQHPVNLWLLNWGFIITLPFAVYTIFVDGLVLWSLIALCAVLWVFAFFNMLLGYPNQRKFLFAK